MTRNASSDELASISDEPLEYDAVYPALLDLGVDGQRAAVFKACRTEPEFLDAVATAPVDVADLAWSTLGLRDLKVPQARFTHLDPSDDALALALQADYRTWELFLHPSQEYLATQPVTARLAISGSAGTGKTVCAWYRCDYLKQQGHRVAFVCPNESSLAVSMRALSSLPSGGDAPGYLIPRD